MNQTHSTINLAVLMNPCRLVRAFFFKSCSPWSSLYGSCSMYQLVKQASASQSKVLCHIKTGRGARSLTAELDTYMRKTSQSVHTSILNSKGQAGKRQAQSCRLPGCGSEARATCNGAGTYRRYCGGNRDHQHGHCAHKVCDIHLKTRHSEFLQSENLKQNTQTIITKMHIKSDKLENATEAQALWDTL